MEHLTRWDVFIAALGAMTPLLCVFLAAHIQNRADRKKSDQRMDILLQEFPLHGHDECKNEPSDEPLLASGIRFPRSKAQ
jgi:hypothetical protein